jgi:flagellar hook protein FlgE
MVYELSWSGLKIFQKKPIRNTGLLYKGDNEMNITGLFGISISGLRAFFAKQNVTADNVANMNTEDFKPSETRMNEDVNGGVYVTISKNSTPGVDLAKEMTDMMITPEGVKANLSTLKTADEMIKSVIDLKA